MKDFFWGFKFENGDKNVIKVQTGNKAVTQGAQIFRRDFGPMLQLHCMFLYN